MCIRRQENNSIVNLYEDYIAVSRYARYLPEQKRRETWEETVDRYVGFFNARFDYLHDATFEGLRTSILNKEVLPSMRALMTADPTPGTGALSRDNVAGYNCAYLSVDHVRAFDEALYICLLYTSPSPRDRG